MKTIRGLDVKVTSDRTQLPFVVSLTKSLRMLASLGGEKAKEKIETIGRNLAHDFESDPALKESLQNDPRALPNDRVMRQVDIKEEDNSLLFKAFVSWNKELNCWHIFLELPGETVWEDGGTNV